MNILSLIQSQLSPQAISQISTTVGESPENTKSALGTAIPAVLGSLISKSNASPDGATQILNTLQQRQGGWTDSISSLLTGGVGRAQPQSGTGSLLNSLLGSKLGPVSEFISSHCGIKGSSAMSILGMAAPLVMGTLGKQITSQGLGAAGLGQLLSSQAGHLKDLMPAGLANTLGIGNLLKGSHDTTSIATEPAYASASSIPAGSPGQKHGNPLKWAVPLVAAAALVVWGLSRRTENTPAAGGTANISQTQAGRVSSIPDLSSLNLPPGSTAERMVNAIKSGNWSQNFELQNLNFDNSGQLTDKSSSDLQQISSLLKAAPNLKLSVTGYGSTSEEGTAKANSIKSMITSSGISEDRIFARGNTGSGAPTLRLMK